MRADTLKGHLDGLVLATLAAEPAHGYAVIEELKRRSGGAFDLPEGTVYPVLHRLEKELDADEIRARHLLGPTKPARRHTIRAEPPTPSEGLHRSHVAIDPAPPDA